MREHFVRDRIECGIFFFEGCGQWVEDFISNTHQKTNKINLFKIDVSEFLPCNVFEVGGQFFPHPNTLKDLAVIFERYDCLIIPILPETLVWTRVTLAQLERPLHFPIIALPHHVNPLAFIDLASLGISEYIFEQDDIAITRIRLSNAVDHHRKMYASLHNMLQKSEELFQIPPTQSTLSYDPTTHSFTSLFDAGEKIPPKKRKRSVKKRTNNEVLYTRPFQLAKAQVIREFERNYVSQALMETRGNICAAAKRSNKHRRAFWELMQKYDISAEDYRVET